MITKASRHAYPETQARLEAALQERGLTVFAKIDHAAGARQAGLEMRPAAVSIFGNPKGGTPFMVAAPASAIDFPLKALVWEDAGGTAFVGYYAVASIVERYGIAGLDEAARKLDGMLAAVVEAATG